MKSNFIAVFLFFSIPAFAQKAGNMHDFKIPFTSDTIHLDTLSIVPSSFIIRTTAGKICDSSFYFLNPSKALLVLRKEKFNVGRDKYPDQPDSVIINYRTFPFYFERTIQHKDIKNLRPDAQGRTDPFAYTAPAKQDNMFGTEGLSKNGSISRGISFGNNQDVVLNSNLNLQVSGKLSNNVDIVLAATDNNIPFQPDGNTQQLQDFDKVFIQLSDQRSKLLTGDFQTMSSGSYFLRFNKKARGLNFSTSFDPDKKSTNKIMSSVAVSRGKFARNVIQGIENNQGPYRLAGAENEPFIIILSGTERVYIDGELLQRGQQDDYLINYNTSEITFTPKRLITKDKRIIIEFQYSDKNYARSLMHFGDEYERKNLKLFLQAYSEQDSKNQPLQQELSDDQKKLLFQIGDTLSKALIPGADSIAFNTSEVLYGRKDSLVGTHLYTPVYAYSNDTGKAHFRLSFNNVGQGNGNYMQISSGANGRVFKWVMPDTLTGIKQGNFEPVVLLITPKQKQMLSMGGEYAFSKTGKVNLEAAISNNDLNTFSSKNSDDDVGYALKVGFTNLLPLVKRDSVNEKNKTSWGLQTNLNYEMTQRNFVAIERFRGVEFERDWNRALGGTVGNKKIGTAGVSVMRNKTQLIGYNINSLSDGTTYNGLKHQVTGGYTDKNYVLNFTGSFLQSKDVAYNTQFLRHYGNVLRKFKYINIGAKEMQEKNIFSEKNTDTLAHNSYEFFTWDAFVNNGDSSKNKFQMSYGQRTDYAVKYNLLATSSLAENMSASMGLLKNSNNQFNVTATYRKLTVKDSTLTKTKPDNTLLTRIEHSGKFFKGAITSNTFYEIGSGLELKKEFSFIEVAPGQGSYSWIDYNENGIKELNEFEISLFPDQARYIKVYTPTNTYIKTHANQFSQTIYLKPALVWSNKKGFRKLISHFADQATYKTDRKTTSSDPEIAYNPFLQNTIDPALVTLNSSLRNTLFFNQTNPVFGADLNWQDNRNKSLLVNGLETRYNITKELKTRWNMTKAWSIFVNFKDGKKYNFSEFFAVRNYRILSKVVEPKLSYQPNTAFRTSLIFKYTQKNNTPEYGLQKAILQDYGIEMKYNILSKGSLNIKSNYINITYNDIQNTALAFEMLEGLRVGKNITWGISWQRTLPNNMQINFSYDGRKPQGLRTIHTGSAQVRVVF